MAERGYETDLLSGLFKSDIARRATCPFGQISDRIMVLVFLADVFERPILIQPVFVAYIAHGHDLDPGQIHLAFGTPFGDLGQFGLVEPFQSDSIDLDPQASLLRCVNAVQHPVSGGPIG